MSTELKRQFFALDPQLMLAGVDAAGFQTTGQYIQLNSYENRVFDVFLEPGSPWPDTDSSQASDRVIVKYYRPMRWSQKSLLAEHFFLAELKSQGVHAISPLNLANNSSLFSFEGLWMAAFPKGLGRMPEELNSDDLRAIGRTLARIHNIGAQKPATDRLSLNMQTYGWPAIELLQSWVAPEVWERYQRAANEVLTCLESELDESKFIRIHGDCHKGNILKTDPRDAQPEYFFVDFDDFCNGPTAQDFWMLFSETEAQNQSERDDLLAGYEELRDFPHADEALFAPLRGLRIIHYAAWIARRWEDPSFPKLFPQFREYTYWAEETEALEQIAWSL